MTYDNTTLHQLVTLDAIENLARRFHASRQSSPDREWLWQRLSSIERFGALPEPQQGFLAMLAACAREGGPLADNTIIEYSRRVLEVSESLCRANGWLSDGSFDIRAMFLPEKEFLSAGVFGSHSRSRNSRIAGVNSLVGAAVGLGLVERRQIVESKAGKFANNPVPAPVDAVDTAYQQAVEHLEGKRFGARVRAWRDLVGLDLKTYGLRSIEMHHTGRCDIQRPGIGGILYLPDSKTETGKRPVYLDPATMALIDRYLDELDADRARLGKAPLGPDAPLLIGQRGEALSSKSISSNVSKLLPENVRPHQLRTLLATRLAVTLTPQELARVLGIRPDSTSAYVAARNDEFLAAQVSEARALTNGSRHLEVAGIVPEEPDAVVEEPKASVCQRSGGHGGRRSTSGGHRRLRHQPSHRNQPPPGRWQQGHT